MTEVYWRVVSPCGLRWFKAQMEKSLKDIRICSCVMMVNIVTDEIKDCRVVVE